MTAQKDYEKTGKLLENNNQSHLLAFCNQLDQAQRHRLLAQISNLDFAEIDEWIARIVKKTAPLDLPADLTPAPSYTPAPTDPQQKQIYAHARKLGKNLIAAGKVAAFVVAGGQGTRLGFDGPKGNFPISPLKNKTLFQIFAETIAAVQKKYQTTCPWYIMTSPLNHSETIEIFQTNDYYGLDPNRVFLFQQGTLPNFALDGKILLADKANIASSPDGHGGSLKALFKSGALEHMKKHGVEFISYWQIDNPLVNILDPLFIGLHARDHAQMSSKAVIKTQPKEKVGNFCLVDGKVTVIEYSDLPDHLAEKTNPDGSLVFQLGSIAIHIINRTFVEKLNAAGFSLPLHRAVKRIPHIDHQGRPVEPTEPNGVKLETFIFDALPLTSNSIILQTHRDQEFAPAKNAAGTDSAQTARQMMIDRAADWLESAGLTVPRKGDGSPDCIIEIAPAFALEKDDIKPKRNQIPQIKPADKLCLA
jgi:UDP-N-acetylglucosamine/UDP-N-acetylgalactosamine diphosphorylase